MRHFLGLRGSECRESSQESHSRVILSLRRIYTPTPLFRRLRMTQHAVLRMETQNHKNEAHIMWL
ncbi:hypothetical protein IAD21_04155 [Abditibacteriota bacterium]|nr:hypothetical protein IAD21_04155 [Abditibacteriota bacterium]